MKRKDFLILTASIGISLGFTSTIFLSTKTNVPRRRRKAKNKVKSKIHKCEEHVVKLLKGGNYLGAIKYLEEESFDLIEPKPYNYKQKSSTKGFKLLNLLAGLKLRHQSYSEFESFVSKMAIYSEQNTKFRYQLLDNWSTDSFKEKWSKQNSRTQNNIRTWADNVV